VNEATYKVITDAPLNTDAIQVGNDLSHQVSPKDDGMKRNLEDIKAKMNYEEKTFSSYLPSCERKRSVDER
jgi:hypothetical protein